MPKLFYKTIVQEAKPEKISNRRLLVRAIGFFLVLAVSVSALLFVLFKVQQFVRTTASHWDEIKFAYEKPNLVQPIREDYENRELLLQQALMQGEPTATPAAVASASATPTVQPTAVPTIRRSR